MIYLAESNTGANPRGLSPSKPPAAPVQMPQVPSSYGAASAYDQGSGSNQSKSSSNLQTNPSVLLLLDVPFDVINQAQKLCRYANSALEHEDVATAIKNCEQVLQLLRPYNH